MRVQVACVIVESFFSCVTIKRKTNGGFASSHQYYCPLKICIDETLPNLIKEKHPTKGGKKRGGQGPKSRQANSPKEICRLSYLLGTQIELFWGKVMTHLCLLATFYFCNLFRVFTIVASTYERKKKLKNKQPQIAFCAQTSFIHHQLSPSISLFFKDIENIYKNRLWIKSNTNLRVPYLHIRIGID